MSMRMKRNKPLVIIADTVKGYGVDFIANVPLMHGVALCGEKLNEAEDAWEPRRKIHEI